MPSSGSIYELLGSDSLHHFVIHCDSVIAVAIPRLRRCNIHHVFRKPGKMITLSLRSIFNPFKSPFPTPPSFIFSTHLSLFLARMSQNSCASASHRSGTGGRLEAIETLALAIFLPQSIHRSSWQVSWMIDR